MLRSCALNGSLWGRLCSSRNFETHRNANKLQHKSHKLRNKSQPILAGNSIVPRNHYRIPARICIDLGSLLHEGNCNWTGILHEIYDFLGSQHFATMVCWDVFSKLRDLCCTSLINLCRSIIPVSIHPFSMPVSRARAWMLWCCAISCCHTHLEQSRPVRFVNQFGRYIGSKRCSP